MIHIFRLVLRKLSEPLLKAKLRFVQLCFPLRRVKGQKFLNYIPAKPAEKKGWSSTGESTDIVYVSVAHKLKSTLGGCKFKHRLEATFREGQREGSGWQSCLAQVYGIKNRLMAFHTSHLRMQQKPLVIRSQSYPLEIWI